MVSFSVYHRGRRAFAHFLRAADGPPVDAGGDIVVDQRPHRGEYDDTRSVKPSRNRSAPSCVDLSSLTFKHVFSCRVLPSLSASGGVGPSQRAALLGIYTADDLIQTGGLDCKVYKRRLISPDNR